MKGCCILCSADAIVRPCAIKYGRALLDRGLEERKACACDRDSEELRNVVEVRDGK